MASFSEEEGEEELEDKKSGLHHESSDSGNVETSDYHSATSSDCGSDDSSDAEEEIKEGEVGNVKEKVKDEKRGDKPFVIAMKPRVREPKPRKIPISQVSKPPDQKIFWYICYLGQNGHIIRGFCENIRQNNNKNQLIL